MKPMTIKSLTALVESKLNPINYLADYTGGGESRTRPGHAARWLLVPMDDGSEMYAEYLAPEDAPDDFAEDWDDETDAYLIGELRAWLKANS